MVEGIHFTSVTMSAYDVGWKLCASNFSDMAAMGADPIGFVIQPHFLKSFTLHGLSDAMKESGTAAKNTGSICLAET